MLLLADSLSFVYREALLDTEAEQLYLRHYNHVTVVATHGPTEVFLYKTEKSQEIKRKVKIWSRTKSC